MQAKQYFFACIFLPDFIAFFRFDSVLNFLDFGLGHPGSAFGVRIADFEPRVF